MDLPRGYNKTLQRAFPDCRMRWSNASEEWLLERRANYARLDIDPSKYPAGAVDTFIQRRDGYYEAGSFAARNLPDVNRLVAFLRLMDPRNLDVDLDNPEAHNIIADRIEAREQAEEAAKYASTRSNFVENGADILADANIPRSYVPREWQFSAGKGPDAGAVD